MKPQQKSLSLGVGVLLLATLCGAVAQTTHDYTIASSPPGVFGTVSGTIADGAELVSPAPPQASGDLRFACWEINGVAAISATGPALTVARAAVDRDHFTMTARYLSAIEDSDHDGIPDWREWRELGTLDLDPSSDPDGDGLTVAYEMGRGYPLATANTLAEGGVFRVSSATFSYHDPARRLAYHFSSDPAGLLIGGGFVEPGGRVTTPNLYDANQGRKLGYWTVNGTRFAAPNGGSPAIINFFVTQEDTQVVAHYFDENLDSDDDGLTDWQEYRLFGGNGNSPASDPDGDGLTVAYELVRGYPPNIPDTLAEGGVFRSASPTVIFHNPGAICAYAITTDPAGYYSDSGQAAAGTVVTLPNLFGVVQGNRFACWLVDGTPFAGPDGACPLIPSVTLTHDNMRIVAKFLPENQDSDVDGIPDWMEWWKFGGLAHDQASDPDHDGFSIGAELVRGYPLSIPSRLAEGGVFRSASATFAYHDSAQKFRYSVASDPPGLVADAATVDSDTVYTSPNLYADVQGYTFTCWTVDGIRQNGPDGSAQTQIIRTIDHDGIQFVAHYQPTARDSDGDGIPDWFEIRYFSDLAQNNTTNATADPFANGVKIARGYPVTIPNTLTEGGVFRSSSASVNYHDPSKLVVYQISSDPAGLLAQSAMVAAGTVLTTPNLAGETPGYTFVGWTVDGIRQQGSDGVAETRVSVVLDQDYMQIVAHYLPTTRDADADGMPDWYEQFYFGTLDHSGASDPNGDGWTINTERARGYSPAVANSTEEGGVFRSTSKTLTYHDPAQFKIYEFASDPAGLLDETNRVQPGTTVLTPNLYEARQGYRFAYWTVNGVRQAGPSGIAQTRMAVTVNEDTRIIAHYVPDALDSDTDGIPDWWEWFYFGSLDNNRVSETDGDGFTLGHKLDRGYTPGIAAVMAQGGVHRTSSKTVRWYNPDLYATYVLRSEPEGLLTTQEGMVTPGLTVLTPFLHGITQGYAFAYWSVDGVPQTAANGGALGRLKVTVNTATQIVAHYLPANTDTDGDGILDAYDWNEFGGLQYSPNDSPPGDGWRIGQEITRGMEASVRNTSLEGGVFRTSSVTLSMNLTTYNVSQTLTAFVEPAGTGSVVGAGSYKQGIRAVVTANPNPGYAFSSWSGDLSSTANPSYVEMFGPRTITAHFIVQVAPYDQWKAVAFSNAADRDDPAVSGEMANPAHDGVTNLMKYALALAPMTSGVNSLPTASLLDGYLALTYRKSKQATDVTYAVQACDSLTDNNWNPATTVASQSDEGSYWLVTVRDNVPYAGIPNRFMLLRVTK